MEGHSAICFFHSLSGSTRGFQGVVSISIASMDANNTSNILISAFRSPVPEVSFFCRLRLEWHQYKISGSEHPWVQVVVMHYTY